MWVISSLVSAVISVAVVLVLKSFDKQNNSMDKVRTYANNRIKEFDNYFKIQDETLVGLRAELETKQTECVAAIHRIEKQIEQFKEISRSFDKEFAAVDEIGAKINAYGRAMNELMEMTARVEQNLENVRKESVIIDKLNKKIDEEKHAVEAINKRIPTIIQEFNGNNQEHLKAIATELLNQYKTRAEEINSSTQEAKERAEKLLSQIDESIHQAYAQAATKATTLEDSVFEKLKENVRVRSEGFARDIKNRGTELENLLAAKITEFQSTNDARFTTIESDLRTKADSVEAEVSARTKAIQDNIQNQSETMNNLINTEIGKLDGSLKEQINALDIQSKDQAEEIKKLLTENLGAAKKLTLELQNEVNGNGKSLKSLRETLQKQASEIQTRYTNLFEKAIADADAKETKAYERYQDIANKHLDDFKSTVESKINGMHEQLNVTIAEVTQKLTDSENGANITAENIAKKAAEASEQLQSFQTEADQKIAVINETLGNMMSKLSQAYDAKQTELLGNVDKQLAEYRKDMEMRFDRLTAVAKDVDNLEANLRGQLAQTEKSVVDSFNSFTAEQQIKQNQFENKVKTDSQDLATQIQILEKNLDEIKSRASDNVSATLRDFEESFGADLKKRSDAIDENLNTWKANFESKLEVLGSDYKNERTEIERRYNEEMKQQLSEIQQRTTEEQNRFKQTIEQSQADIQNQITEVGQQIRDFTEKARGELSNATSTFDGFIKQSLDGYAGRINEQMERAEKDSQAKIDAMTEEMVEKNQTNAASIDAMISDFNIWKTQLTQQFEQSKQLYSSQLGTIKQGFDQSFEEFKVKTVSEQNEIAKSIEDLKGQVATSISGYREHSESILSQQKQIYDSMLEETGRRVKETNAEVDQKLQEIKNAIQRVTEENGAREAEFVMKMQNDATDLQSRMSEIDHQVKAFASQLQNYQKAEQLKTQIDNQIEDLKKQLGQIETYQASVDDLERHFKEIQDINTDINGKLTKFAAEKNHIDTIERNFDRLIELSGNMDNKIHDLQATSDDLQSLQLTVRNFQETLGSISDRYERLEKKGSVIDQVAANVDKTFDQVQNLERRLEQANRQTNILPEAINQVQANIDNLMSSSGRINDAVDKVTSLQGILDDTERRIVDLQSSREGIARTETRLKQLSDEIDSKFSLLKQVISINSGSSTTVADTRLSPEDKQNIHDLKKMGWKNEEIARSLKRSLTEIELVLEMPE